jgi:hypothetical protein
MGLKPLQPDYTGGTGDYNRMPFTLGNEKDRELSSDMGLEESTRRYGMGGTDQRMIDKLNMGRGAYAMQPDTMYLGGSADFDESTGRYRSGYVPPDRGMVDGRGAGLGNLVAGGVGSGLGARLPFGPGTVDPRTRVGPQYDPTSIAFPTNDYSNRGNSSLRDDIARRALMLRDQNAAGRMAQNLGNYQPGNIVPYGRKPIPG